MREPERTFMIYYFSEVSAKITLIRSHSFSGGASIIAKAKHPSGTGMANWYHFTDTNITGTQDEEGIRASVSVSEYEKERDAVLTCLTLLADKLWPGLTWKQEREDGFDKNTFYKDILQAFIVGEWGVNHGRVSGDVLPPKDLSTRSLKD